MATLEIDPTGLIRVDKTLITEISVGGALINNPRAKSWDISTGGTRLLPSITMSLNIEGLNGYEMPIETKTIQAEEPRMQTSIKKPSRANAITQSNK